MLQSPLENGMFFKERAILCSKNATVKEINTKVQNKVVSDKVTLHSADSITGSTMDNVPEEYLHSLTTSGLPPAKLELKVGLPVMLLRNLNPEQGLCNGTRCIIHQIGQHVLKVKVLGVDSEQMELIPRFTLSTLPNQLPFILTRKQFPVKVSFAMTINKSQGQSPKKVAIDLREPVFTHGQLYLTERSNNYLEARKTRKYVLTMVEIDPLEINAIEKEYDESNSLYERLDISSINYHPIPPEPYELKTTILDDEEYLKIKDWRRKLKKNELYFPPAATTSKQLCFNALLYNMGDSILNEKIAPAQKSEIGFSIDNAAPLFKYIYGSKVNN